MALTCDLFHTFQSYPTINDLWKQLAYRCEGDPQAIKGKRELLRKQYECFRFLENELLDALINRFYQLLTELKNYEHEKINEKFLDALPSRYEL